MSDLTPFDFVKSITETKHRQTPEEIDKGYVPYMTNKALSFYIDTIFDASQMNRCANLSKDMQYDYYFYSVRRAKKYGKKWPKVLINNDVEVISQYYDISIDKAREYLKLLDSEQINLMKEKLDVGGVKNK